jgi:hypothetical protein
MIARLVISVISFSKGTPRLGKVQALTCGRQREAEG